MSFFQDAKILYQESLIFTDKSQAGTGNYLSVTRFRALDLPQVGHHHARMIDIFEFRHRVTADEIDELGHAGNYHYVKWLQYAAVAHTTANSWTPERYDKLGAGWVVRSHNIVYLKPAFERDTLVIRTWVANMKPVTSLRRYEITTEAGALLAKAETDWAFVNRRNQRPTRIPEEVKAGFIVLPDTQ